MALTDNLQAFYKLSDLSDSSGNNRTLTNNGNVTFAPGKIGNAAVFDGSNWMSAPINQTGITDYTLACWVKLDVNSSGPQFLINGLTGYAWQNGGITLDLQDKYPITYANFGADSFGYGLNSQTELSTDTWYHLVGVRSNGLLKIYINGSVDCVSQTTDNTPIPGGSPISLGQNADGTYGPFTGALDAVGIWNRALSDAEVAELYNNGTGLELNPPNYRGEWDNFTYYGQDDVVSVSGVYWKLTGLGGWTVGGAPGLGYGWTLLAPAPVGGKVSLSGRISLSGRVKFAV